MTDTPVISAPTDEVVSGVPEVTLDGDWAVAQRSHRRCSRGFAGESGEAKRRRDGESLRGNRVVAAVTVAAAGRPLFFNVGDLTAGGHFAILSNHASAPESRET